AGHEVTVVDGPGSAPRNFFDFKGVRVRGLTKEEIVERIPEDSEVIALGCMFTSNWVYVREIVKDIRQLPARNRTGRRQQPRPDG
ncbi:MAG: hypothetical protein OEZ51_06820, partial [Nitrospinota bacterium]|nr:hypothetical protein [Nitrospinota bacterium]